MGGTALTGSMSAAILVAALRGLSGSPQPFDGPFRVELERQGAP